MDLKKKTHECSAEKPPFFRLECDHFLPLSPYVQMEHHWLLSGLTLTHHRWGCSAALIAPGRGISNTPLYLFNESDLLSFSYLLPGCLCSFLFPPVTLLGGVASLRCLPFPPSLFPSGFHFDHIRPPSWSLKVSATLLAGFRAAPAVWQTSLIIHTW